MSSKCDLERYIDASPVVIYRCDATRALPATYVSRNIFQQLGYRTEEFINHPGFLAEHIHPEDRSRVVDDLQHLFETGHHLHCYRFQHKNGDYRWLRDEQTVICDDNNQPIDVIGSWIDITAQKQLELEKEHIAEAILNSKKMQAICTLAGGMAHEFNNMLGVIIGYTELVQNTSDKGSDTFARLNRVLEAALRSRDLVRQLLAIGRKNNRDVKELEPCEAVNKTIELLKSSLPSTVKYHLCCAAECPNIMMDNLEFRQMMVNLCRNSADAMELDGIINIHVEQQAVSAAKTSGIYNLKDIEYLLISVSDTGDGIDHAVMDRIFEPFFTTKDVGEGVGMGLALVYSIVSDYDGAINVISEAGTGTTIQVYLPIDTGSTNVQTHSVLSERSARPLHILLVDDEKLYLDMEAEVLAVLGYQITSTTDPVEALTCLRQSGDDYDLVITDQVMPEMLGTDLAVKIRSIRAELPVLLCSGYADSMNESELKEFNIDRIIAKPFVKDEIAAIIQSVC